MIIRYIDIDIDLYVGESSSSKEIPLIFFFKERRAHGGIYTKPQSLNQNANVFFNYPKSSFL